MLKICQETWMDRHLVQQLKCLQMPTSTSEHWNSFLAPNSNFLLLSPGDNGDPSSYWAAATHVQDLDWISGSGFSAFGEQISEWGLSAFLA